MRRNRDEQRGHDANLAGHARDPNANVDWLRGWDNAQADRELDEDDWDRDED